jgi:hypothetical protein
MQEGDIADLVEIISVGIPPRDLPYINPLNG